MLRIFLFGLAKRRKQPERYVPFLQKIRKNTWQNTLTKNFEWDIIQKSMKWKQDNTQLFYKNNALMGKFIFNYFSKFLFYGYLFLIGSTIMGLLFFSLYNFFDGLLKYLQFIWFVPIIYCTSRFGIILSTTRYKWRFYRISHYRLNKKGYSENYFKYEIYEPCTRIIVKNILYEYGLKYEYKALKKKYLKVNQRLEDQKVRILSEVIHRHEQKQTQEVLDGKKLQG
jgi:hypothetical protein